MNYFLLRFRTVALVEARWRTVRVIEREMCPPRGGERSGSIARYISRMAFETLPTAWERVLSGTATGPGVDLATLYSEIDALYATSSSSTAAVYPDRHLLFRAYHATPPDAVRLIIVGQDPYPQKLDRPDPADPRRSGVADGFAFSAGGLPVPESLRRILWNLWVTGEISVPPVDGSLSRWAVEEGILLLNSSMTVASQASIRGTRPRAKSLQVQQRVWEPLISGTLTSVQTRNAHVGVILIGAHARGLGSALKTGLATPVVVLNHPSRGPWPAPAFTQSPFADINKLLANPIDWSV